jgi:hypothetical protein
VILAVAVTALDENHPLLRDLGREPAACANIKKLSERYRSAAMQCLTADQFLYQHNLQTVQTLVLMIYAMNHANISSWALLGMTFNIAVRIGCHVDPSRLGLGVVEGEERRRCWAALMMLYTVQNTCMGNVAPQNITAEVELPADLDDDQLLNSQFDGLDTVERTRAPSKMSYILYKFRLYNIAADICQCALDEQLADPRTILALDQRLTKEDQAHASRFSGQNLPVYHIAHHHILQSYTHHLYLVLHRASLNSQSGNDSFLAQSRQRCETSAITILEAHGHLYETAEFRPYMWYTIGLGAFHAFLAVSILIILADNTTLTGDEHPRIHVIIEECLSRFESMAPRSDVCSKAVVILRQVLRSNNQPPASEAIIDSSSLKVKFGSMYQYPVSPISNSEQNPVNTCDWASNPELEALLFEMAPQQWMGPNYFTWDHWNSTALV